MNFYCCKLFVKYCLIVITVYGNKQVKKITVSIGACDSTIFARACGSTFCIIKLELLTTPLQTVSNFSIKFTTDTPVTDILVWGWVLQMKYIYGHTVYHSLQKNFTFCKRKIFRQIFVYFLQCIGHQVFYLSYILAAEKRSLTTISKLPKQLLMS